MDTQRILTELAQGLACGIGTVNDEAVFADSGLQRNGLFSRIVLQNAVNTVIQQIGKHTAKMGAFNRKLGRNLSIDGGLPGAGASGA